MKKLILVFLLIIFFSEAKGSSDEDSLQKAKIQIFTGKINFGISQYKGVNISQRQNPFDISVSGMPMIQYKIFQMPINFLFSNLSRKNQQPYNYLGLIPSFQWGRFYLGDTFIDYSPYTLNGHRIRGVGFDLYPGKHFRLGVMYGQMQRPIAENTTIIDNPETYLAEQPFPAFKRMGYAIKLGFVIRDSSYIDLLLFKAKDQIGSIPVPSKKGVDGFDTVTPAENLVIGTKFNIRLARKLFWTTDMAVSVYTKDQTAAPLEVDLSENKFLSRIPKSVAKDLIQINASSQVNYAAESVLSYWDSTFNFKLKFKQIAPNYKSLGSYNFFYDTDIRKVNFMSTWQGMKGKVTMNSSLDYEKNNIKKSNFYTGRTVLTLFELLYFPTQKFGAFLQYSGTSSKQTPVSFSYNEYGSKSNLHNAAIIGRYSFENPRVYSLITFTGMYNYIQNQLVYESKKTDTRFDIYTANLGYNLNLLEKGTAFDVGLWRVSMKDISKQEQSNTGVSLGATQSLLKNKASIGANYSLFLNQYFDNNSGKTHQVNINLNYYILKGHKVWFRASYLNNNLDKASLTEKNFSEFRTMVGYDFDL
ncbi:hypothetical protein [Emticicia sp.]|uniref:hypothetical protein n=1 Tax=Emticicia sp. TaxID=1930953 RepID=UPI0037510963